MYWMLLPPSANAGRHLGDQSLPLSGYWNDVWRAAWGTVVQLLASHSR